MDSQSPQTLKPQAADKPSNIDRARNFEQSLKQTEHLMGESLLILAKSFKQYVSSELSPVEQSKAIADAEKLTRTLERARKFGGADIAENNSNNRPDNTNSDNADGGCSTFAEAGGEPDA